MKKNPSISLYKKKNLLFIARNYPPNIGGMEILNFELSKQLKKYFYLNLIYNSGHRYSVTFLIRTFLKALMSGEKNILLSDPLLSFRK